MQNTDAYTGPVYTYVGGILVVADLESRTLDVLARYGTRTQAPPTMGGAHLTKITPAQHAALHVAETTGRIQRGGKPGQAPVGILTALARKECLVLVPAPGTYSWLYGTITARGRKILKELDAAAAAEARRQAIIRGGRTPAAA